MNYLIATICLEFIIIAALVFRLYIKSRAITALRVANATRGMELAHLKFRALKQTKEEL